MSWWCHLTISSFVIPSPPPALNLSQHQGLFQWVGSLHQVANALELQFQHQSFQWIFRVDFFADWIDWSLCSPWDPHGSYSKPQFKSISSSVLSLLYGPALTAVHFYGRSHSFGYADFVSKVMFLRFNTLSMFIIAFFPRKSTFEFNGCGHCLQWFWSPRE